MKNNIKNVSLLFIFSVILTLVFISSCKKTSYPPIAIDKSYFPLVTGKYIIYDVDSLGYWGFNDTIIHSTYQIKEEVDTAYIDNTGDTAYKIIRSKRKDESSMWIATDVWSANLTDHTAEKVEENLRFIKLDFPIVLDRQWYGNSLIETDSNLSFLEGWRYEYTSVHQPLSLNGYSFDSTLTVTQDRDSNAIKQYVYIEKYAKNVGMIYKYEDSLSTQPSSPKDGRIVTMTIREHN